MILFSTPQFIIQQFTLNDAEVFYLLNSNEAVMRFIRPVKNRHECDEFLQENINLYKTGSVIGRYAVINKISGNCIGTFSFLRMSTENGYHIGYALLPNFWGKGFAQQLVKFGTLFFFTATNKQVLFAITQTENTASQNALLKNGFLLKSTSTENNKQIATFYINKYN
ncbi:MAG: GNAT family N-acetyltransferase [Deinococcales bacterium]|nr:GNAT family N-acetyltransferase [Chitinophagaceae bacterium]